MKKNDRIRISDVLLFLSSEGISGYCEREDFTFETFCPLGEPVPNAITWARHAESVKIKELNAVPGIVLVAEMDNAFPDAEFPILYTENVHRTFFRIVAHFFMNQDPENRKPYIAPSAVLETENIGEGVYVGHHSCIGKDVKLGNHVTVLNNVTIQGKVTIGDYTTIESGTVIGACGFGHYEDEDGNPVTVPHLAGVRIGCHVRIGANCVICRGCLGDTVIEDYVKIDNLCNISHNDRIGHGAMLASGTVISGSVSVGENAWLAPGTLLINGISVGNRSYTGLGCVAMKDVPAGKVAAGMPARILGDRG